MGLIDSLLAESIRAASHHGMEIADGVLCLPAGLDPERVRKLSGALRGEPFPRSDPAMLWFMGLAGVKQEVRDFIDCFIDEGKLDFVKGFERLSWKQRLKIGILGYQALGVFDLLRDYIVAHLQPRPLGVKTLGDAVAILRSHVAERMNCEPDWDVILDPKRAPTLALLGREWDVGSAS